MSRIVDNLVKKGYFERKISSGDRRTVEISLSQPGMKRGEQVVTGKKLCELKLKYRLSEKEHKTVDRTHGILLKVLDEKND